MNSLARAFSLALLAISSATGSSAFAAPPPLASPGTQVLDPNGGLVGTVVSTHDKELILKTDRHEVRLPLASFTLHQGKLYFGMTREALNQETDELLAKSEANLLPGSEVRGTSGALAGHIEAIDDAYVTLKLVSGEMVRLPRSAVAPGKKSAVLGISASELQQLASQAAEQP